MLLFTLISEIIYLYLIFKARSLSLLDLHIPSSQILVIAALVALFVVYFLGVWLIKFEKVTAKQLFASVLALNLVFLMVPFLTSNDLYSYIFQTRVWSAHGQNPYLIPFDKFPDDPIYMQVKTIWSSNTLLQGPVFAFVGGFVNLIGQNNLNLIVLIYKSIFIGATLLCSYLIYLLTKNLKSMFLFGANPLIIFELSGNVHTDSLLIAGLLVAFWVFQTKRFQTLTFATLMISALIKYSTVILAPLFLISFRKSPIKQTLLASLLALFILLAAYLPFWEGKNIFSYLRTYYQGQFISPSLGIVLGEKIFNSYPLSFQINTIIFIGVVLFCYFKYLIKNSFENLALYSLIIYLTYILTKLSLILTWDLAILVALSSLYFGIKPNKLSLGTILFTTIYSLGLYYFIK